MAIFITNKIEENPSTTNGGETMKSYFGYRREMTQ